MAENKRDYYEVLGVDTGVDVGSYVAQGRLDIFNSISLETRASELEELYDDVDLLNRCFIAKDEKDGKIIKKDFNYKNGQFLHVADYQELKKIVSEIGLCP